MKLSLIVPAYNEESRNITSTLDEYYNFLKKKLGDDFEMGIIPNNCSDRTESIVLNWVKLGRPNAWVHTIKGYSGKGGAVMRGFDIAKGDYIGFVDADNSINVLEFWKLYQKRENAEAIIASRKAPGAKIIPPRRWTQDLSSWMFNKTVKLLFGLKYYDTQCGCKLFNQQTAKYLKYKCKENGWAFDVELLWLIEQGAFSRIEQPIIWTDCEGSKLSFFDGIKSVLILFKLRWKRL